ncbi:hypothetical protein F4776DRAFT_662515 [Hypoxylon sp. NC0597]|nr:hypothetical protein F4776DRAFT_662515 [Hypoxylon sp. NC0597]
MGILRKAALLAAALVQYGVLGQSETRTSGTKTSNSPSATITGAPFEGFIIADSTTIPVSCSSGEVFITSASFAACCATTSSTCAIATACKDNAVAFENGARSDCGPLRCHSRKIYSTYGEEDPAFIEAICASAGEIDTLYRAVPMTSQLILPLAGADSTTVVSADGIPVPTASAASTTTGNNESNGSSSNTDVIILVSVLGGIAALGLIIFAFWYGRKRGEAKKGAESRGAYEMKMLSQITTSESLPRSGPEVVLNWGAANLSGPLALSYTHNKSQQ